MSKVEHYHTGLLREIISYLQEESERKGDESLSFEAKGLGSLGGQRSFGQSTELRPCACEGAGLREKDVLGKLSKALVHPSLIGLPLFGADATDE